MTSKELLWPSSITLTKLLMVTYCAKTCFPTKKTPYLSPRTMPNFKLGRAVDPLIPDKPKLETKDYFSLYLAHLHYVYNIAASQEKAITSTFWILLLSLHKYF